MPQLTLFNNLLNVFIFCQLTTVHRIVATNELGKIFKICNADDALLNQCIVDSLNGARDSLKEGLPVFGLPPLKALPIRLFSIDEGPGDFHLKTTIYNATWSGLETYNVISAKVDLKRPYMEFTTVIPKTLIQGPYTFDGRLLTLRIFGEGTCDIEFRDTNVTHRIDLVEEARNGQKYWKISKYIFDMEMQHLKVNYKNLFKGNKRLGAYANNFINNNWKIIYQVYGNLAKEGFGVSFMEYANILLEKVPLQNLFTR